MGGLTGVQGGRADADVRLRLGCYRATHSVAPGFYDIALVPRGASKAEWLER